MDAIPTIVFLALIAAGFAVWLYALVDVVRADDTHLRSGSKLVWVLVVLLRHLAGAVLYLGIARPRPAR